MNKIYFLVFALLLLLFSCEKNEIDIGFPCEGDGTQINIFIISNLEYGELYEDAYPGNFELENEA